MERALARHPTLRARVFTPEEIAYCDSKARPAESYAGRFAAREAVIKALGGYRGKRWQDISVTRHAERRAGDRADREREGSRRPAGDHADPHHVHAREDERGRVRRGGDRRVKPVLSPRQAVELDRATQARGVSRRGADGACRVGRRASGGRRGGRRLRAACGRRVRQGEQRRRRIGGRPPSRALGHAGGVDPRGRARAGPGSGGGQPRAPADPAGGARPAARGRGSPRELGRADVAVDAVFGTGFRGVAGGDQAEAIQALNAGEPPVVAVDIPSGVDGETGAIEGEAVWADLTVTFGAAKVGAVSMPGAERAGDLRVVDIGFPRGARADGDGHDRATGCRRGPAGACQRRPQEGERHARRGGGLAVDDGRGPVDRARGGTARGRLRDRGGAPARCSRRCRPGSRRRSSWRSPRPATGPWPPAALEVVLERARPRPMRWRSARACRPRPRRTGFVRDARPRRPDPVRARRRRLERLRRAGRRRSPTAEPKRC